MSNAEDLALREIRKRCEDTGAWLLRATRDGTEQEWARAKAAYDAASAEEAAILGRIGGPRPDVDFRPMPGDEARSVSLTVDDFADFPDDIKARFVAQFGSSDAADEAIAAMNGPITYLRGPAPEGADLVATHNDRRSRWHMSRKDFEALGTMDAVFDVDRALRNADAGRSVREDLGAEVRASAAGADLSERGALKDEYSIDASGNFLPRDTATYLRVMRDAHLEMFISTTAPQQRGLDDGTAEQPLPGGVTQYFVLAYDEKSAVVSQEHLGRITELGATAADDKVHHHTSGDHRLDDASDARRRVDEALTRMQRTALSGDDEGWRRAKEDFDHALQREQMTFQQPGHGQHL